MASSGDRDKIYGNIVGIFALKERKTPEEVQERIESFHKKIYNDVARDKRKTPQEVQNIIESFANKTGSKSELSPKLVKERSEVFISFYQKIATNKDDHDKKYNTALLDVYYDKYYAALLNVYGFDLKGASKEQLGLIDIPDILSNEALNLRKGKESLLINNVDKNPRSTIYVDTSDKSGYPSDKSEYSYSRWVQIQDNLQRSKIIQKSDPAKASHQIEIEILSKVKPGQDDSIKTKHDFDKLFAEGNDGGLYKFSSDDAKKGVKFNALKVAVGNGNINLVKDIYDDVEYVDFTKFNSEILRDNDPKRKNKQEKAISVLKVIPQKGGNDEKREEKDKSITQEQLEARKEILEYVFKKAFFLNEHDATQGLDVQFISAQDIKKIYDKASPAFQSQIKIAVEASLENSLRGEYEKYHVNGVTSTRDGKQTYPVDKFTQLGKLIDVDFSDSRYTKALFKGIGEKVKGTYRENNPAHNAYFFLRAGGKLDSTEIKKDQKNKEVVEEAFDKYILGGKSLGRLEQAKICVRNGEYGKCLSSLIPNFTTSNDKTSTKKIKATLSPDEKSGNPVKNSVDIPSSTSHPLARVLASGSSPITPRVSVDDGRGGQGHSR